MLSCRGMFPTRVVSLLYPPTCLHCHAPLPALRARQAGLPSGTVCEECAIAMPDHPRPVCVRCGVGLPGAFDAVALCPPCRRRPPHFEMARAPWPYAGPVQDAIRQFKYHRHWRLGRWLADGMSMTAQASLPMAEVSAVLPVPLHWLKRWLRGWNPAEELAASVAHSLGKPCRPRVLRRIRWTATQTRLGWRARARNVREAFAAREHLVRDQTLLLVDDVLTSGATANACARALRNAGARRVLVLTAARTPLT